MQVPHATTLAYEVQHLRTLVDVYFHLAQTHGERPDPSLRMAHRLADMHDVAPELTEAVAARVTTGELHDQALRDLGGVVYRTVVENEHVYAVRIDDGVLLDGAEQVEHARNHLTAERHAEAAAALGCEAEKLDSELDALAARAKRSALKLRVDGTLRDRAANGRYGWVFERGQDFAAGIWVIDPVLMLDAVRHELADADGEGAREEAYFGGARLDDDELRDAAEEDRQRRAAERIRHAEAAASNLTLGHDIRAALADPPTTSSTRCARSSPRLLCEHHPELIAYGAGWTDAERQQPVATPAAESRATSTRSSTRYCGARSRTPTRCTASPSWSRAGARRSCSTRTT